MNLKFILKALSFSLVTSFVFAAENNDCNAIENYLKKKSIDYKETIEKCVTNDQGKVEELVVRNYALQKEDVKQILSYKSIKNLEYTVDFKFGNEPDTDYSYPFLPHPGYTEFPSVIADLPELENLKFVYDHFRRIKYSPEAELIKIENESLKLSKKLKTLTFSQVKFSKENLKELSKLNNLEEMNFNRCEFEPNDFAIFENNKKLTKLSIYETMGMEKSYPDNIEKLKSLKHLHLENTPCKGSSYDISALENLESFYFETTTACDLDLSKLNKLTELSIISSNYVFFDGISDPMNLKFPDSLKILNLSHLTLKSNDYKKVFSLPNLEELLLYCYDRSDKIEIKSIKSHDKLRKLTINTFDSSYTNVIDNLDFLKELENLTYLELVNDRITEIPQLKYLKKLEHLDLSRNELIKIPEVLPTLKNIEYIDLSSNVIYGRLSESLNKLENLKYFDIDDNRMITGKVLTNKNIEKCGYSDKYDLCIPKDYKLNCSIKYDYMEDPDDMDDTDNDEKQSFKTCEEEEVIEESTDDKCGEGHGKCPSGQCCNKEGKCSHEEDYCLVSKGCQMKYGDCIDECEVIYQKLYKSGEDIKNVECIPNKEGKAKNIKILFGNNNYLKSLENVHDLESISIDCNNYIENFEPIAQNQNLTKLTLSGYCYENEDIPEELLKLENLKTLELEYNSMKKVPKNIKYLKNLENLTFLRCEIEELPDEYGEFQNLKSLNLEGNELKKFPEVIAKLKNLEYLNLGGNEIDDKIPESYNNLSELKTIILSGNQHFEGKILQNKKLVQCEYDYEWDSTKHPLCRTGNEKCLTESSIKAYPLCPDSTNTVDDKTTTNESTMITTTSKETTITSTSEETITTTITFTSEEPITTTTTSTSEEPITTTTTSTSEEPITTTTTSTSEEPITTTTTTPEPTVKGKCGEGIGKCKSGYCCSKYGWCGKTEDYCGKGCQSEFGDCKTNTTTTTTTTPTPTTSVNGKCGKDYGKCPSGQCCSKYGWCGKTSEYCGKGCQSEFGKCKTSSSTTTTTTTTTKTTTTTTKTKTKTPEATSEPSSSYRCGKGYGKCRSDECCSKYGWCGKSDDHCAVAKGCQSKYGLCKEEKPSVDGKCGKGYGKCPSGQCCSKYGWCGKGYNYCAVSEGCQSDYGLCTETNTSIEGKCGEGYGKCPSGQCCSAFGWCGTSNGYCSKSKGCQSKYGKCK